MTVNYGVLCGVRLLRQKRNIAYPIKDKTFFLYLERGIAKRLQNCLHDQILESFYHNMIFFW